MKNPKALLNIFSLVAIQGGNALIPLVLFPYFLSRLGADKFSKIAIAEAISLVVLTFVLYSFDISGLKKVIHAKNKKELAEVYYSILGCRALIFICACLVIFASTYFISGNYLSLAAIWLMLPLGVMLQSSYYYQAKEDNFPLAVLVSITRLASVVIGLSVVNDDTSIETASAIIAMSYAASGVMAHMYINHQLDLSARGSITDRFMPLLKEGWPLFLSNAAVILYRSSNTILLSSMAMPPAIISAYAIAEKYIKMLQAATLPIGQFFSIRIISQLAKKGNSRREVFAILWGNTKNQLLIGLFLVVVFLFFLQYIEKYTSLGFSDQALAFLKIMAVAILFGISNYTYGVIGMNSMGHERIYARLVIFSGFFSVVASIFLIEVLGGAGAAIAYVAGEVILFSLVVIVLKRVGK